MVSDRAGMVLRYRWFIYTVLALAYFFVYFHRLSISVVATDLLEDFQTNAGVIGLLGAIYFYCYAIMQIPAGLLSDSVGPRKTVTFSLAVAAVGSILFGFAPSIGWAVVGRILVGFGVSMVFIPTMKALSQWYRVREFATMAGFLNAVGGIGVLAATWILALMTSAYGWRLSFKLIGVATLVLVVLAWIFVRNRPSDKGWPSMAEIDEAPAQRGPEKIPLLEGLRTVVTEKYFWPLALWFFFELGVFFGFGGIWGGPYLEHVYELKKSEAGAILGTLAWGMIVGSPLLSFLSDRVFFSRKRVIMVCSAVVLAEFIFLNLFPAGLPTAVLYVVFLLLAVSSSAVVVIAFTTSKELFPIAIAGTAVGMVNLFPFLGGAVFMPGLGKMLDAYGRLSDGRYPLEAYKAILLVLLVSAAIAFVCTFFLKETFPKTVEGGGK